MRRDIERGMRRMNLRSDANALDVSDLGGRSLFDGNLFAGSDGKIERGNRRGNIKRHVMFAREDGDLISADFVGGITICGDAVGSGDNRAYVSRFQRMSDYVVGNYSDRDSAAGTCSSC